jgi:hypothetical protein
MTEDAIEAREEQEEHDRALGQHILDITANQDKVGDWLADVLREAYRAKAEEE